MDIPVVEMISRSGWIARLIVGLLGVFSIITWAIIINRILHFGNANKSNRSFLQKYLGLKALTDIDTIVNKNVSGPLTILGKAGVLEYTRIIADSRALTGVTDWSFFLQNQFGMAMERINTTFSQEVRKLDKGIIFLAIASSVAPFLGLLGTVWGIMNSFFQIGNQGSASLPVVAPGIAEALVTTIIGLVVAIPAVLFYNFFVHQVERIEFEMDEFKNLILSHLKRDMFNLLYGEKR